MRAKLLVVAGGCALAFAAPAAAAPGQCFDAAAQPIGPIYDTEAPDTRFITWVQARGGECRALRMESDSAAAARILTNFIAASIPRAAGRAEG